MISYIVAVTFVIYLISAIVHGWTWLTRPSFFKDPGKLPQRIAIGGFFVQTAGILFIWMGTDSSALVFSHLAGMLYLLTWFFTAIYLGTQYFIDVRWSGVVNMTLATLLLAFALLSSNPIWSVTPVGVEFETICYGTSIFFSLLGYAFLLSASIAAVFLLVKEKMQIESLMLAHISFVIGALLLGIFKWGSLFSGTSRIQFEWVEVISLLLWSACFILLFVAMFFDRANKLRSAVSWFSAGGLIFLGLHLFMIMRSVGKSGIGPHLFVILFGLLCVGTILLRMYWMDEPISNRLPEVQKIESLLFHFTVFGFSCATIGWLAQSGWSYGFVGQYVQWNVKEMWVFVIWFFYGAILHNRIFSELKNWSFSVLSLLGFFMIIFAVLRVNWVVL